MKLLYEEKKNAAKIALASLWTSAIIFFIGLIMIIGNFGSEWDQKATIICTMGGILMIGTYLTMKYALYQVKTFQEIF